MRILIVQTSFLGDVVLSTPVFAALHRQFPQAHISVLVRPESAGVLAEHPAVNQVLVDDKRGAARGLGAWRTVRMLKQQHFDTVLSLHKSWRTAWVLAAAGIPRRLGFRESAGWILFHRCTRRDRTQHEVERNLAILRCLDLEPNVFVQKPFVAVSAEAVAELYSRLEQHGIRRDQPLIGIAPGSAWATKRWTVEGFAVVMQAVQERMGCVPLLLGAKGDREVAAAVQAAAGGIGVNLVGQTSLPVLVAAIDQCRAMVTNDSGPLHIAVARDTPVVALFGPTALSMGFGPFSEQARVVERQLACRPCSRHGGATCPIGTHACMREIAPRSVLEAVHDLLGNNGSTTGRLSEHDRQAPLAHAFSQRGRGLG